MNDTLDGKFQPRLRFFKGMNTNHLQKSFLKTGEFFEKQTLIDSSLYNSSGHCHNVTMLQAVGTLRQILNPCKLPPRPKLLPL